MFNLYSRIIRHPFDGNLRRKTILLLLFLIWTISVSLSAPISLNVEYLYKTEQQFWACEYAMSQTSYFYNVTFFACLTFIPLLSLITFYIRAAKSLAIHGIDSNNIAIKRRNAMNKKVVKLFTVIVCTFAVLTIPYYLYNFAYSTCLYYGIIKTVLEMRTYGIIFFLLTMLIAFNCCVNPLIYCKMHRDVSKCVTDIERRFLNYFSCFCRKTE